MVPTSSVTALKATVAGRETTTSITETSTNSQVLITTTAVITMVFTGTGITPMTTPTSDMVIASPVTQMSTFVKGEWIKRNSMSIRLLYLRYGEMY